MAEMLDPLEQLWSDLLSRDKELISAAFQSLNPASQQNVLVHLHRMLTEDGWHREQRKSAQAALDTLDQVSNGKDQPDPLSDQH
jgi:hypothetical protein